MKTVKQVFQNLNNGDTKVLEVPCPNISKNSLLIETELTLISAGTEKMLVDFGKSGLLNKARSQPDKVKQVLDKIKTDGLFETIDAVKAKLDQPLPLGYSNVGRVVEVGEAVKDFKVGDRVLSNGPHATYVAVGKNLCAKIPDNVSSTDASFSVLGAIALQGIRLSNPSIGENYAVFGLGLIGLLTVQILIANGIKVIAFDFDENRLDLAKRYGAATFNLGQGGDPVDFAMKISENIGVDAVLLTAATKSSDPVHQGANMCRKRGRIVLVGVTGLELNRADFYEKELTFQVSCSYGPGRYDAEYEVKGNDYPLAYVRWTEQRNFKAVLDLLALEKISVTDLVTHDFNIRSAADAYNMISQGEETYLGVVLKNTEFKENTSKPVKKIEISDNVKSFGTKPKIAFIGAGNFAGRILLPAFKKNDADLLIIGSHHGVSGANLGKKFGFFATTTDLDDIYKNEEVDVVVVTTRHDTHKDLVVRSLKAGKHVFVEKPLCLNSCELNEISEFYEKISDDKRPQLFVGFNRRFSPFSMKVKNLLENEHDAKYMIMTVNAGFIPKESWIHDYKTGGGRIIGECCHFIDLFLYLTSADIVSLSCSVLESSKYNDSFVITIKFSDGSLGVINYFSNGPKSYPKERLEVFVNEKSLSLDNFRSLKAEGFKGFSSMKTFKQDKGHANEVRLFLAAIEKGEPLISFSDIKQVTESSFKLQELTKNNQ